MNFPSAPVVRSKGFASDFVSSMYASVASAFFRRTEGACVPPGIDLDPAEPENVKEHSTARERMWAIVLTPSLRSASAVRNSVA
jgi:hypothetical protein